MVTKLNQSQPPQPRVQPRSPRARLRSLWAFARPHTIVGTSLSVCGLGVMAVTLSAPVSASSLWWGVVAILTALVPSLCANVYIVGLNQLTDIAIDRINKPRLPLAAGTLSVATGRQIVLGLGLLALVLSGMQGSVLLMTVLLSMVIGTVYSLPPLRLKRFPFWAALCIFGVRGLVVNLGFFIHFRQYLLSRELNAPIPSSIAEPGWLTLPPEVWALTGFVVVFAVAIALFKDIPDLEGDRQFHVRTLTVRLGSTVVFQLSLWVLLLSYILLLALALGQALPSLHVSFLSLTHLGLLALLAMRSRRVNLTDRAQIKRFYQFIWKLFFLEYILFPLACLLGA